MTLRRNQLPFNGCYNLSVTIFKGHSKPELTDVPYLQ